MTTGAVVRMPPMPLEKLGTKGQFLPWLKPQGMRTPRFGGMLLGPYESWAYQGNGGRQQDHWQNYERVTRCSVGMESDNSFINGPWTITIIAGESNRTSDFDGIIDLNGLGELVGVEILDFRRQTGAIAPRPMDASFPRYGYDAEIDAFYLHVAPGNAPKQEKAKGTVALDADNHILGLTVSPAYR